MNGQRKASSGTAAVRRLSEEIPWTHPEGIAPWYFKPEAWTPWNWSEARDQYETRRKAKSESV